MGSPLQRWEGKGMAAVPRCQGGAEGRVHQLGPRRGRHVPLCPCATSPAYRATTMETACVTPGNRVLLDESCSKLGGKFTG